MEGQLVLLWHKFYQYSSKPAYWLPVVAFLLPLSTSLSSIAFVVLLLLSLVQGGFIRRWHNLRQSFLCQLLVIGFILVVIASFYSISSWHESLYTIKKYAWLAFIPFLLVSLDTKKVENRTLIAFVVAVVISVICSYLQHWFHFSFVPHFRITTVFQDRIKHGYLVLIALIILIHFICMKRYVVFNAILCALLVVNIAYVNESRTSYLLLPIILLPFFLMGISKRRLAALIIVSCASVVTLLNFNQIGMAQIKKGVYEFNTYQINAVNKTSLGVRLDQMFYGLRAVKEKPILGYGTGSAGLVINQQQKLFSGEKLFSTNPPPLVDCGWVNIIVQWGTVGFIYFIVLFATLFKTSEHLSRDKRIMFLTFLIIMISGCLINNWLATTIPTRLLILFSVVFFAPYVQQSILTKGRISVNDDIYDKAEDFHAGTT